MKKKITDLCSFKVWRFASVTCRCASFRGWLERGNMLSCDVFCCLEEVWCSTRTLQLAYEIAGRLFLSAAAGICGDYIFSVQSNSWSILSSCCQTNSGEYWRNIQSEVSNIRLWWKLLNMLKMNTQLAKMMQRVELNGWLPLVCRWWRWQTAAVQGQFPTSNLSSFWVILTDHN